MALVEFIEKGLIKNNELDNTLGDRKTYIGASDIGGCLRKAYLDKVSPKEKEAQELTILLRGHLAEDLVAKALDAQGVKYQTQLELQEDFIRAHLDFVFCSSKECVVVEVKSTNNIPDTPYSSWVLQIQLQMYLAQKHFGLKTRGYILVLNLNTGEMKEFSIEPDETLQDIALNRAKALWDALQNSTEPEAEEQLYCSKCPYKDTCPLFQAEEIHCEELENLVNDVAFLESQKKEIDKELKIKKEKLLEYLEAKGIKKAKIADYLVSVTASSSFVSLDTTKLKKEAPELYEELIAKFGKQIVRKGSLKIK